MTLIPILAISVAIPLTCVATLGRIIPMGKRILHIYGKTRLQSDYCEHCRRDSFITDGLFVCCDREAAEKPVDDCKFHCDMVGVRKRQPTKAVTDKVLREQGGKCIYCDAVFGTYRTRPGKTKEELVTIEWDHSQPFVYTGRNDGFVAACGPCNRHKHAKVFDSLEDARAWCRLWL
jgi:hypothetical protein